MVIRLILGILTLFSTQIFATTNKTDLNWVGCGISKKAYMIELVKQYKIDKGINVNLQGGGATRGIHDVATAEADLGGSCRYYLPGNATEQHQKFEPIAWDALAVIIHKNNAVTNITTAQIKKIYSGEITNWQALGGPNKKIALLTRKGKISGVGHSIRKLIFQDVNKIFTESQVFRSSTPLEKAVETNPYALAITGISSARHRTVKILKLDSVYPDYRSIKKGKYALYRPLYLVYNPNSPKLADIRDFITYAHSKAGKRVIKKNHVVPYLDALNLIIKQMRQEKHHVIVGKA